MSVPQHSVLWVPFDQKNSRHFINVYFHRTRRGMRSLLTKNGHKHSHYTAACCWQTGNFDGACVGEIHLPLEGLRPLDIIHESVHAALHRCKLIGSLDKDWNEESVAYDTANVACSIMALWRGIKRLNLGSRRRKK